MSNYDTMRDSLVSSIHRPNAADINGVLEAIIDFESLGELLGRLSAIALGKAEHITMHWGDKGLADNWEKASHELLSLAEATPL